MQCNPFEMEKLTAINNITTIFNENVYLDLSILEAKEKEQLINFVQHRLVNPSVSIDTKILKKVRLTRTFAEVGKYRKVQIRVLSLN